MKINEQREKQINKFFYLIIMKLQGSESDDQNKKLFFFLKLPTY